MTKQIQNLAEQQKKLGIGDKVLVPYWSESEAKWTQKLAVIIQVDKSNEYYKVQSTTGLRKWAYFRSIVPVPISWKMWQLLFH